MDQSIDYKFERMNRKEKEMKIVKKIQVLMLTALLILTGSHGVVNVWSFL